MGLLKAPSGAGNLPQRARQRPAHCDRQHGRDLNDRRQIVVEQPVLQPEHDRVVHQEHAMGVTLSTYAYLEAREPMDEHSA
jgi:hypothetical protein